MAPRSPVLAKGSVMDTFDQLLDRSQAGDSAARDRLVSLVLEDLRGIAAGQLDRERTGHTLQATALVNEAWLRLSDGSSLGFDSRSAFLAAATVAMRRILIDHARGRKAAKRGGPDRRRDPLPADAVAMVAADRCEDLLVLDEAIEVLANSDHELGEIVRLRFFAGLSVEQIGRALELSPRTVKRRWSFARAWLLSRLQDADPGTGAKESMS